MTKPAFWLANAGVAWCALMSWMFTWRPVYAGSSQSVSSDGTTTSFDTSATLAEVNGDRVLYLLAVPLAVALVAWLGMHVFCRYGRRGAIGLAYAAASLLLVFSFLGGATIGLFYMPAAAVLLVAASRVTPRGDLPAR
jgi:hypothetical protein